MSNEFLQTLQQYPVERNDLPVLQVLDEFCDGISDYTANAVQCRREPGFLTNLGQEWRVVLHVAKQDFSQTLLRAHVPLDGYPVLLDMYEEKMTPCASESALRKTLTKFLQRQTPRETIEYLKGLGSRQENREETAP